MMNHALRETVGKSLGLIIAHDLSVLGHVITTSPKYTMKTMSKTADQLSPLPFVFEIRFYL